MTDTALPRPAESTGPLDAFTFASDFGLVSFQVDRERSMIVSNLTDKLRTAGGFAPLGLLVTIADYVTSDPALVAVEPDWTATQDLSLHSTSWVTEGPIVVDSRLVRAGKKVVVVSAEVYDGHSLTDPHELAAAIDRRDGTGPTLAAQGLVTFARIPRAAAVGADEYTPGTWVGTVRERPAVPVAGSIHSRLGMRVIDAERGILELDNTPFVANQIGTIMGGAQALLAESAALGMRPGMVAADMQIHFLAQLGRGAARSYGTVVRDSADHSVVTVGLVDADADDRILALITVTLARPPRERPR